MTSCKYRERTHEASTDNMANEDSLLSVIADLVKLFHAETPFSADNSNGAV